MSIRVTCLLCAEESQYWAIGPCNHVVCSVCSLRLRVRTRDKSCPICKQEMELVIVYQDNLSSHENTFDSFGILDFSPAPGLICDESMGMIFVDCVSHYHTLDVMRSFICPIPDCSLRFAGISKLQKHLSDVHGRQMCTLCVEHRPIFVSEHRLYDSKQLIDHINAPPGAYVTAEQDKIGGHPPCKFCNENFFDAQQLIQHMRTRHPSCPLCSPPPPLLRFYEDDHLLKHHIKQCHYICTICDNSSFSSSSIQMDPRMILSFSYLTSLELESHLQSQHGYTGNKASMTALCHFQTSKREIHLNSDTSSIEIDTSSPDPYRIRHPQPQPHKNSKNNKNHQHQHQHRKPNQSLLSSSTRGGRGIEIPSHMKVAGVVTGSGLFRKDASLVSLQEYCEDQANESRRRNRNNKNNTLSNEEFPVLQATEKTHRGNTSEPVQGIKASTSSMPVRSVAGTEALDSQDTSISKGTRSNNTNTSHTGSGSESESASITGKVTNMQLRCLGIATHVPGAGVIRKPTTTTDNTSTSLKHQEDEKEMLRERRNKVCVDSYLII